MVDAFRAGGPAFALGGGWLWVGVNVHGPQGTGGTVKLVRFNPATDRMDDASLEFATDITDVEEADGVVRVLLPGQLVLVDARSMHVTARVTLPGTTNRLAIGAGSDWVAQAEGNVLRIDQRTHVIVATVPITSASVAAGQDNGGLGGEPSQLVVSGGFIWATMDAEQRIARIDPARDAIVATYPMPFGGVNTVVAAADGGVWLDFFDAGRFAHIDPAGQVQTPPIDVPQPVGFVVVGGDIWFASHRIGELWRVDIASGRVLERIAIGGPAGQVLADGTTVLAWGNGELTRVNAG